MSRDSEYVDLAGEIGDGLFRRALLLTADWQAAEDLVQETFSRVYAQWSRVRRDGSPAGYAYTTLYRLAIDRRRRRSFGEKPTETLPERSGEHDPELRSVQYLDLLGALSSLAPDERFVVVARYLDDLPVADVAAAVHRTEAWVRTTSSRALKRLRDHPALAAVTT